ncbi:MAG: HEPN domain-containing protein [Caldisphaera sp.]|nr:HEPN domain-containing protein [Caldisphaera sp.]
MSHFEEYKYLIERSKRFYETAIIQIEKEYYDLAAFSLEQGLQLFLKATLIKIELEYPRTQSIRRLLELIYEVTEKDEIKYIMQKFLVELALLEDIYITSRYIPREYRKDEVLKIKETVDEVINVVGKIVN